MRSYCETCGHVLETLSRGQVLRTLLLSLACLVLLVPANIYPIIRFSFQGQWSEGQIITGALLLFQQGSPIVGLMVLFTGVVAPFALHFMVSAACICLLGGWFPVLTRRLWGLLFEFKEWGMIDIYLVAFGVGAIKLLSMGSVDPRPALWLMLLFVLISGLCLGSLKPCAIWTELRLSHLAGKQAKIRPNMPGCAHCGSVATEASQQTCQICESPLHPHHIDDRRVWAYMIATVCLYIPANLLPVMTMSLLGHTDSYTVVGGIMYLWHEGNYLPAIIVFGGSIIVPAGKIIALFLLLLTYKSGRHPKMKTAVFMIVKTLGRWSMVDIFVLAVLVALGQMGVLATIEPESGALAFCGMVVLTIFAANNFQSRWIWAHSKKVPLISQENYAHEIH